MDWLPQELSGWDLKSPGFQKMEGASVAVASGVNLAYGGVQDE